MHIEIHYLPSIEYISLLCNQEEVIFEQFESFPKQTYRNRCKILGANGVQNLVVPIQHAKNGKILCKDVQIDYSQTWQRQHVGAIQAAYGKSAYYEYFAPLFFDLYQKKSKYLLDLNIELLEVIFKIIGRKLSFKLSEDFESLESSFYNFISAKRSVVNTSTYSYRQCFGEEFVPNLSVLDLLMNCGRESGQVISSIKFEQI